LFFKQFIFYVWATDLALLQDIFLMPLLEIIATSLTDALLAVEAGADRLELVSNLSEGGTSPSYGTLVAVRKALSIPVFPMIRPRGGDFVYAQPELEAMLHDLRLCKELGFEGAVCGMLTPEGEIDQQGCRQLLEAAGPLELTFHRAFDLLSNPQAGLEILISIGFKRVLTSGNQATALEGKVLLRQLVKQSAGRIGILPGGGIREAQLRELHPYTQAKEFHSSGRSSGSLFVDTAEVKKMKACLTATP
jgi:copper homeostasis protein